MRNSILFNLTMVGILAFGGAIGIHYGFIKNAIKQHREQTARQEQETSQLIEQVLSTASGEDGILSTEESIAMAKSLGYQGTLYQGETFMLTRNPFNYDAILSAGENRGSMSSLAQITQPQMRGYLVEHNRAEAQ